MPVRIGMPHIHLRISTHHTAQNSVRSGLVERSNHDNMATTSEWDLLGCTVRWATWVSSRNGLCALQAASRSGLLINSQIVKYLVTSCPDGSDSIHSKQGEGMVSSRLWWWLAAFNSLVCAAPHTQRRSVEDDGVVTVHLVPHTHDDTGWL